MGNCLGMDVQTKYKAGGLSFTQQDSTAVAESEQALALLTGSLAYSTWLEVHISCTNLRDADTFSNSDPMAVLYTFENEGRFWTETKRTECIQNTRSPDFVRGFRILYNFEKLQQYKVVVVDVDKGQDPAVVAVKDCRLTDILCVYKRVLDVARYIKTQLQTNAANLQSFLGRAEFTLSEVVTARGQRLSKPLFQEHKDIPTPSSVSIRTEEISNAREIYHINLAARGLRNVERFGKSDPFCRISRLNELDGTWQPVYKTETKPNQLDPVWGQINIRATQLNNGDPLRPLKLEIFDYEGSGRHRLLALTETNVTALQELCNNHSSLALHNAPGRTGPAGTLQVTSMAVTQQPTFLDYIQGGTELSFIVAIDFTASNGPPTDPRSLHYLHPSGARTQYEEAICGVGQVLEFYDSDRQYPVFGFGGRFSNNPVNHCFSLATDPSGMVNGIQGILQAYRQGLGTWQLHGPTLFAPIIRTAAQMASQPSQHLRYQVLLILTDGCIMDMQDTINAIIEASAHPLSILIVGIGNEDFSLMHNLDSDNKRLQHPSGGAFAERDIVQFVEFNRFRSNGVALAQELLAELPGQFLQYMASRGIRPPVLSREPTPVQSRQQTPVPTPPDSPCIGQRHSAASTGLAGVQVHPAGHAAVSRLSQSSQQGSSPNNHPLHLPQAAQPAVYGSPASSQPGTPRLGGRTSVASNHGPPPPGYPTEGGSGPGAPVINHRGSAEFSASAAQQSHHASSAGGSSQPLTSYHELHDQNGHVSQPLNCSPSLALPTLSSLTQAPTLMARGSSALGS